MGKFIWMVIVSVVAYAMVTSIGASGCLAFCGYLFLLRRD